jgi:hypothetical protein
MMLAIIYGLVLQYRRENLTLCRQLRHAVDKTDELCMRIADQSHICKVNEND